MARPEVSILIPVYNREVFVVEAVRSACRQSLEDIQIIVVDNCSTDGTYDVVRVLAQEDRRIQAFRNDANLGPVLNWERCISLASGEFTKFVWSDDWIDPRYLEKTVPLLLEHEDAAFVFTPACIHSGNGTRVLYDQLRRTGVYDLTAFVEEHLFWGERFPVSPGCALFRTRDVKKNLLIDIPNALGLDYKKYGQGNDLLLFLLCLRDYSKFCFQAEVLSHFRDHAGCLSAENLSLYALDAMRHFVETDVGRAYRDRYYSFLFLRSLSRNGKLHASVLKDANYRKDWGFMFRWQMRKDGKRLKRQARKYLGKLTGRLQGSSKG